MNFITIDTIIIQKKRMIIEGVRSFLLSFASCGGLQLHDPLSKSLLMFPQLLLHRHLHQMMVGVVKVGAP